MLINLIRSIHYGLPVSSIRRYSIRLGLDEIRVPRRATRYFWRAGQGSNRHGVFRAAVMVVDKSLTPVDSGIIIATVGGEFKIRRYKLYPERGLKKLDYPGELERIDEDEGM